MERAAATPGVRRRPASRALLLACAVLVASPLVPGHPASAGGAPLSSAGRRWALVSAANGLYVASEINDGGGHAGMLRARSASVGGWETFTLHTADRGATVTLRSEANGRYATAEIDDGGADEGMVRARGTTAGSWEQFTLVSLGSGLYALRSKANGRYVTTEVDATGGRQGMLRARATSAAGWERYRLVPVGGPPSPPAAGPARADTVSVMSWNVCADNNSTCPLYRATSAMVANTVAARATDAFAPDALMLQEFCEKDAKPLELALEARTGRGWDVRFAPIQYFVSGTVAKAQKLCGTDRNGADRGSYGVALAVPDVNTWYAASPLTSPPAYEQRTVLCATVESRALNLCTAHFSSAGAEDDPTGAHRTRQVSELLSAAGRPGHRSIVGGDLNLTPPDAPSGPVPGALNPVYDAYEECEQSASGGRRTGTPTYRETKLDYIFGPASATYECRVASQATESDHKPIYARVTLPAT